MTIKGDLKFILKEFSNSSSEILKASLYGFAFPAQFMNTSILENLFNIIVIKLLTSFNFLKLDL